MAHVETSASAAKRRTMAPIIDCDVHNAYSALDDLYPYLRERWVAHLMAYGARGPAGEDYPRVQVGHTGSHPPSGRGAGADSAFVHHHLLDAWNIHYAVFNPLTPAGRQLIPELDAALATAINEWQAAEWLDGRPALPHLDRPAVRARRPGRGRARPGLPGDVAGGPRERVLL